MLNRATVIAILVLSAALFAASAIAFLLKIRRRQCRRCGESVPERDLVRDESGVYGCLDGAACAARQGRE